MSQGASDLLSPVVEDARHALQAQVLFQAEWDRRQTDRRQLARGDRRQDFSAASRPLIDRRDPARADRRSAHRRNAAVGHQPNIHNSVMPLDWQVDQLMRLPDIDAAVRADATLYRGLTARLADRLEAAFGRADQAALTELQRCLYHLYNQAFESPMLPTGRNHNHALLQSVSRQIERRWEAQMLRSAQPLVARAEAAGHDFESRLAALCQTHRLNGHPLFDFIEHEANHSQVMSFFLSDSAVVMRFYDMVVLAMVGAEEATRGELAVNLLEEMGDHDPAQRHTNLFRRLLYYVGLSDEDLALYRRRFHEQASWQCLAGHNLYLFLGLNRRQYFRSLGCLGSAELMDSAQYAKIVRGCQRLGWTDENGLAYYSMHAEVDVAHGRGWLERVMQPMVDKYPGAEKEFLLGSAIRLDSAAQYYDQLLDHFRVA